MQMAFLVSQESKCASWKVGAIIEKDGVIVSGYNGTPHGHCNCDEHCIEQGWAKQTDDGVKLYSDRRPRHSAWSLQNEVHAEINALLIAARKATGNVDGGTLYTTLAPCNNCAKAIAQSGIRNVIYCDEYDYNGQDWCKILVDSGIKVRKLDKRHLPLLQWERIKNEPDLIQCYN